MCAYAWHMETTLDGEQVLSDEGYSAFDEERWAPEPPKSKSRTAFERDRARLIHSSALRRLGAKSQILIAGTDDFARTRLTHTLEVAQIGRQIGALLGCDPDVVDCACLAHDLGHPPFGHNGERALADIAGNIGGFEGNAQTMRILTRLEPKIFHPDGRSAGVNLTRAALDAAVKYPWTLAEADQHPKGERSKKFCVYPDDEPVFRWLKIGAPQATKPMECQIMDLSDDIAYSVHDVEDSIATGAFDPIVLADPKMLDHIIEQTRAWYGAKWVADKLLADVTELRKRINDLTFPPEKVVGGAAVLMEEVAATKISGEEDRYSHTDLWDFRGNFDGAYKIVELVRPLIAEKEAEFLKTVDANFAKVDATLSKYKEGEGYVTYDKLTEEDRKVLATAVNTLAEDLSTLRGKLGLD